VVGHTGPFSATYPKVAWCPSLVVAGWYLRLPCDPALIHALQPTHKSSSLHDSVCMPPAGARAPRSRWQVPGH
jgi:hypothetical protein